MPPTPDGPPPLDRPHLPRPPERRGGLSDAQKWTLGGVGALVVLLIAVVAVLATGADEEDEPAATTTTTAAAETTTSTTDPSSTNNLEEGSTTTAVFTPSVDPYDVAFPAPDGSRSFEAPQAAARAYATDVLGFTELVLGSAEPVGEGGAEVVVQDRDDGPETRIRLQRSQDGAWYVLGSETDDVVVSQPGPGTSLATTFETAGEALAFEGNVQVLVLMQSDPTPIGEGTVTGSGSPPAGPFQGDVSFFAPERPTPGILVYRIQSPEDGRVVQATSFRVRLTNLTS